MVFVAFYTAQLTTTLTVEQIRGAIEGPSDLPGKQVATMVQLNSPLRRKINLALIALRENGTYQQIYDKWFGVTP